jgi:hypothetical protein
MAKIFPKNQYQAKYVASDIWMTAGVASVGLLQSLVGFHVAHNGSWVRLLLNKPIKGHLGAVGGLKSIRLGCCPVHSILADLLFYDCNA